MKKQRDRPKDSRKRALVLFLTVMIILSSVGIFNSINNATSNTDRNPSTNRDPVTDVTPSPDNGNTDTDGGEEEVNLNVIPAAVLGTGLYANDVSTYTYDSENPADIFAVSKPNGFNDNMVGSTSDSKMYATVLDEYASIGRNSAYSESQGGLFMKSCNKSSVDNVIFETDFCFTTVDSTPNWYVRFSLGDDFIGSIDNSSFCRVYLAPSTTEGYYSIVATYTKPDNEYLLKFGEWYNLRMEYSQTSDDEGILDVYINGKLVTPSSSQKNNGYITNYSGVYPEIRYVLGTAELKLDNTYFGSK